MASALGMPALANLGFAKRVGPASAVSARAGRAFARRSPLSVSAHSQGPAEEEAGGEDSSARAFRRALGQSANYSRKHKKDADAAKLMEEQGVGVVSKGGLIEQMKNADFTYTRGDVTLQLAKSYGFCWGVERAVQMAYEARKQFPEEKMWITNEIIHNPTVNQARRGALEQHRLAEMGVNFIEEKSGEKDFTGVKNGEVVILPAFGASVQEMKLLNDRGVQIIDTTCPWVSKVWNAVDTHARKDYTSIIHGKWAHEETIATASFATTYLVVKDLKEAQYVCDYVLGRGNRDDFFKKFDKRAMSAGFDPDQDLVRVGIANQTTMLKGETEAIGKLFQSAMMRKHGVDKAGEHFMVLDTICDATQERQDAMYSLVDAKPDMMLVVGGFNSSNTSHLQEISEEAKVSSFWVDTIERIGPGNKIAHRLAHGELVVTENWLPEGKLVLGVTSGASTPDKVVEDILEKVFEIKEGMKAKQAVAR